MSIRHIVSYKMNGETKEERSNQVSAFINGYKLLVNEIPELKNFHLGANELYDGNNWDLTLIVDFNNITELESYLKHPSHVDFANKNKPNFANRAATDFTV